MKTLRWNTTALVAAAGLIGMMASGSPVLAADGTASRSPSQTGSQSQRGNISPTRTTTADTQRGPDPRIQSDLVDRVFVRLADEVWVGGDFKVIDQGGGTIALSGTVPNERAKERIVRITRRTAGVTQVNDRLTVNPNAGTPPANTVPDDQLARAVAQRIAENIGGAKAGQDWWFSGWRVEGPDDRWNMTVEADQGRIYLDGEVPWYSVIRQAVESAHQVSGVRSVRSRLELEPYAYPLGYAPYTAYGYFPYGYPPYTYRHAPPSTAYGRSSVDAHGVSGVHKVSGDIAKLDKQHGTMTLRTDQGTLDLRLPPQALQRYETGDRITVEIGLEQPNGAASPRTEPANK